MKDCITSETFSRFLEDSLDQESLLRLEEHCRACEACARELAFWKALKEKLHEASDIPMPEGFKEKVMARVSKERILPAPPAWGARLAMALSVLAVALCGIFRPFLRPALSELASDLLKSISAMWYSALSAVGIDPAALIRLFGKIMAGTDSLLPVFMTSTALMITGLVLLIMKGRSARQPG